MRTTFLLALLAAACSPVVIEGGDGQAGDADADADDDTDTDTTGDPKVDDDGDGFTEEQGDCDDGDATTNPDAAETLDLEDDDCDGLVDEDFVEAGDLVVSEVMPNPVAVGDANGEWFEVTNTTDHDLDLVGWVVSADDGDTFTIATSLVVPAGEPLALGADADTDANGGAPVAYVYDHDSFPLSDEADSIFLSVDGRAVSDLSYTSTWGLVEGTAIQLDGANVDLDHASVSAWWCLATEPYGLGDLGTPGEPNDWCGNIDHDDDGASADEGDCDDTDPDVYPGAAEVWDGTDNDCDGVVDDISADDAAGWLDGVSTDYLGWKNSLATADFNGDGQVDLAVGGTYVNSEGTGGVFLLDGADCTEWGGNAYDYDYLDIDGEASRGYFGTMGQQQGDLDSDGVVDLVVAGTDRYNYYSSYSDVAVAVFLSSTGYSGHVASDDGDFYYTDADSNEGSAHVASALDMDGDGRADLVYGDYYQTSSSGENGGSDVYIFSSDSLPEGERDLQDSADMQTWGSSNYDYAGHSLGGADLDGDGYDDLLIGAPGDDEEADNGGCIYLVKGRTTLSGEASLGWASAIALCGTEDDGYLGLNATPQVRDLDRDGKLDLVVSAPGAAVVAVFYDTSALASRLETGDADVLITGPSSPGWFGLALASGDLDGDGTTDLVVGAPDGTDYSSSPDEAGLVYLFSGAALPRSGALDQGDAGLVIEGSSADLFGMTLATGDLDGNGREDLLVAAPRYQNDFGRVYLFLAP